MQAPTTSLGHLARVRSDPPLPRLTIPRPVDSRYSESLLTTDLPTARLAGGLLFVTGSLAAVWLVIGLLALAVTL
jgi:hypothetical protein